MPGKSSNGLTELQAKIVELRDEHGLGFREIGEQLGGKNQGNIHRFYTAAKKKLAGDLTTPRQRIKAQLAAYHEQRDGTPVTDQSLLADIDATLEKALFILKNNEEALTETRAKDLTGIVSTLIDKRQLLSGRPTAIMTIADVRKLDEVAKALHDEMVRRGLVPGPVIDVTPEDSGEKECAAPQGAGNGDARHVSDSETR